MIIQISGHGPLLAQNRKKASTKQSWKLSNFWLKSKIWKYTPWKVLNLEFFRNLFVLYFDQTMGKGFEVMNISEYWTFNGNGTRHNKKFVSAFNPG